MNLEKIFNKVANVQKIHNYCVSFDSTPSKTEGFLSELYFGEIKNKDNDETLSIIIKKSPKEAGIFVNLSQLFENENYFYEKIMEELNKFQNKKFNPTPRYFFGNSEYIVMENITQKGFKLYDKSKFFDKQHLEVTFKIFAKFHALSFAYKNQHSVAYKKLIENIIDPFKDNQKYVMFESIATNVVAGFKAYYDSIDNYENFKKIKNVKQVLLDLDEYKGEYKCIIHRDSWSNNLLFKYGKTGDPEDVKFVDFQMSKESTPIHDLAFLFYSSAADDELDNLDFYLEIYYNNFSLFARSLGSDPDILLPQNTLKSEWKKYGLFGVFLAFDLLALKLIKPEKALELRNAEEENKEKGTQMWDEEFERVRTTNEFKNRSNVIIGSSITHGVLSKKYDFLK